MGVGIPYSFAVDPSSMSGPTARLEMQQAGRTFRRYQKLLEDRVLRPLKNIVIADAVSRGLIENNLGGKSTKGIFNFGANVSIDLGRESQANISEFRCGLTTASSIYAEKGLDFESSMRQRALEAKLIKDLAEQYGVSPDTISDINKPIQAPAFGSPTPAPEQMQEEPQDENAVAIVPSIKEQDTISRTTGSDGDIDVGEEREPTEKSTTEDTQKKTISNNLEELGSLDNESLKMLIEGMINSCELGKYSDIDFTPPEGARESAKRALAVRGEKPPSQRGMTSVGIARARDLIAGKKLSPDTIRRMHSFFSRHEVDKKGEGWDDQGKGWQAWNGWGGDAGFSWVKKLVKQMDSRDEKLEEPATCPIATQDVKTNLANRQNAVDDANYGPANPNEPNEDYWKAKADEFQGDVETAKKMRCGNCAAFNQTNKLLGCIKKGIGADANEVTLGGDLGYCEIFDFKCASKRTCDAWIVGGPLKDKAK